MRVFEDLSNQYLLDLISGGTIINGALVGVNETTETSNAKVSILVGEEVKEKQIIIFKVNGNLTWKFYTPSDIINLYEYSNTGWHYPQFSKRIIAPVDLAMQYPAIEVWFRLNNLPIINVSGTVYMYCNQILPQHQALADSLVGVVTIENNPN
jgi:hypothetical protein